MYPSLSGHLKYIHMDDDGEILDTGLLTDEEETSEAGHEPEFEW